MEKGNHLLGEWATESGPISSLASLSNLICFSNSEACLDPGSADRIGSWAKLPIPNLQNEPGSRDAQMAMSFILLVWVQINFTQKLVMAPHSSTLAWKIPWMEEPGRLQSMGSLRVGHDWSDLVAAAAVKLKLQGPSLSKASVYAESCLKCSRLRREVRVLSGSILM